MSEARTEDRLSRLETEVGEIKVLLHRIDERLTSTLPHLATKAELADLRTELTSEIGMLRAELADKPGKLFLTAAIAILIAAYGLGLAGLAALPVATKLLH